jgi:hypothetical protein
VIGVGVAEQVSALDRGERAATAEIVIAGSTVIGANRDQLRRLWWSLPHLVDAGQELR